jgi:hypothetical protein
MVETDRETDRQKWTVADLIGQPQAYADIQHNLKTSPNTVTKTTKTTQSLKGRTNHNYVQNARNGYLEASQL